MQCKTTLLFNEVVKKHTKRFDGADHLIAACPKSINIEHLIELTAAEVGGYEFIDMPHYDFSDGSEMKTGSINPRPKTPGGASHPVEVSNIISAGGQEKTGDLRIVIYNPVHESVLYYFVPISSIHEIGVNIHPTSGIGRFKGTYNSVRNDIPKLEKFRVASFEELCKMKNTATNHNGIHFRPNTRSKPNIIKTIREPLREYQEKHILDPIVNEINTHLHIQSHLRKNDYYSYISLGTGAGKTHVIVKYAIPFSIEKGCDVMYTTPNHASLQDEAKRIQDAYPDANVIVDSSIASCGYWEFSDTKPNIIVCFPTAAKYAVDRLNDRPGLKPLVVFSDEFHQGFCCGPDDDPFERYGMRLSNFTGEWNKLRKKIKNVVAWIGLTATPLNGMDKDPNFKLIGSYHDRNILGLTQKRLKIKKIAKHKYNTWDYSKFAEDNAKERSEFIKMCKRYKLPIYHSKTLLHSKNNDNLLNGFNAARGSMRGDAMILTCWEKKCTLPNYPRKVKGFKKMVEGVRYLNKDSDCHTLYANQIAKNALNVHNINCFVTDAKYTSVKNDNVTHQVVQLFGRGNRWPVAYNFNGKLINNWHDVFAFKYAGMAKGIPEEIMDKYIDYVFTVNMYIFDAPVILTGLAEYTSTNTFGEDEWETFLTKIESDVAKQYHKELVAA